MQLFPIILYDTVLDTNWRVRKQICILPENSQYLKVYRFVSTPFIKLCINNLINYLCTYIAGKKCRYYSLVEGSQCPYFLSSIVYTSPSYLSNLYVIITKLTKLINHGSLTSVMIDQPYYYKNFPENPVTVSEPDWWSLLQCDV